MPGDRYEVRVEEPARAALTRLDGKSAAAIVSVLQILETDPWISMGGIGSVESAPFSYLRRRGYDIRRLKATEIRGWRIFYFVDRRKKRVLVKEIVSREEDEVTYQLGPHVQRLEDNFRRYFGGPRGRQR